MILTGKEILHGINEKKIIINPFSKSFLKSTSYDIHLNTHLLIYKDAVLDVKKDNATEMFEIPKKGYILKPNCLYLATSKEYIKSTEYIPFIEGRSGVGRLGIFIHVTAPKGDLDYGNCWTLELVVVQPVRIYSGMPIGQVFFLKTYGMKEDYSKQQNYISKKLEDMKYPIASQLYKFYKK